MILAITGPTGSGKSTVGDAIAKKLPRCVNIDADHIKHMIVSGFYKDSADAGGWSFSEWALVGECIGLLANNFQIKGFDVVINGFMDEPAWQEMEKKVKIDNKILLLPSLDANIIRDAGRDKNIQMGKESIVQHNEHFSLSKTYAEFTVFDTTHETVKETTARIMECVMRNNQVS